jgi:hypothetical protein
MTAEPLFSKVHLTELKAGRRILLATLVGQTEFDADFPEPGVLDGAPLDFEDLDGAVLHSKLLSITPVSFGDA